MVYECEICGAALPAGVLNCPKCWKGFDEPVPQDAEVPLRGWQPKSEASDFSSITSQSGIKTPATPKIVILQEHHPEPPAMNMPTSGSKSQRGPSPFLAQSTPTASKPKGKKISPWLVFWAIMFLPITLLYLIGLAIVKIWKHPTWSVRTKSILTVLVAAAAITMPINSIVQSVRDQQTAMAIQANYAAQLIAEHKRLAELEATPKGRAKLSAERNQQQLAAAKEAHQRDLAALRTGEEAGAKAAKSDKATAANSQQEIKSDAETTYRMKLAQNVSQLGDCLSTYSDLCKDPKLFDDIWKIQMVASLIDMKRLSQEGENISCPVRFQEVQNRYSEALREYERISDKMPSAVDHRDIEALKDCSARMDHASDLVISASNELKELN